MRTRRGLFLVVLATLALLATPAHEAKALSCGAPDRPFSELADVVFDGVLLSGPRAEPFGQLASPARMHVVRYLKGRGPSVVTVGTGVPLLFTGDDPGVSSSTPGLFEPYPGGVHRVYGDTPKGAGSSAHRGLLIPHPCGGTYERRTTSHLHVVRGSATARRDASGRRWIAELLRGPAPLRCLRIHPGPDHDQLECKHLRRSGQFVAALVPAAGKRWDTALAVSGPGLESIAVDGPLGHEESAVTGPGRVALVVLAGYAERTDLTVTARLKGGRTVALGDFGGGVIVPNPNPGDPPWGVAVTPSHPPAPGLACATFESRPGTVRAGFVGGFPRYGACGSAAEGFFAVRYIDRYSDAERRYRYATIVFGLAPPGVERVSIAGPDGERDAATAPGGGAFAAMYPGSVGHGGLTITLHAAGGTARSFAGQRNWNVVPPPRTALDDG